MNSRKGFRHGRLAVSCMSVVFAVVAVAAGPTSSAEPPSNNDLIAPFPVVTPTANGWAPKYPFPYDQTRASVTDIDITAEREMCQWFNAQYDQLIRQIDRVQFNRIAPNGKDFDYSIGDVQQQVDVVTSNIQQSVDFLAPRAQVLTQSQNHFGDSYFPLYQGESFFHLWQYLAAVNDGILAHQPDWFTGPAVQRTKRWGSKINRSHVCD